MSYNMGDWGREFVEPDGNAATAPITRAFGGDTANLGVTRPMGPASYPTGTQGMLPFAEGALGDAGSVKAPGLRAGQQLALPLSGDSRQMSLWGNHRQRLRPWNDNMRKAWRFHKRWGPLPAKARNRLIRNAGKMKSSVFNKAMAKSIGTGLIFDAVFAGADIAGSTFRYSGQWAAQTGRTEGFIGGGVYGATRAAGANLGATTLGTTGLVAGSALGTLIFPGVGTTIGGIVGAAVGGIAGYLGGEELIDPFAQSLGNLYMDIGASSINRNKLNFGGDFRDSQGAYTMRQLAVQEMAGSLLNARQVLGNEARFLHR